MSINCKTPQARVFFTRAYFFLESETYFYLHAAVDDSQADSHEGREPVQHRRGAHLKVGHEN
jgi:hypothetical protein